MGDGPPEPRAWVTGRRRPRIPGAPRSQLLPGSSTGGVPWRRGKQRAVRAEAGRAEGRPRPGTASGSCCDRPGAGRALGDGGRASGLYAREEAAEGRDRVATTCRYPSRVVLCPLLAHKTDSRSATKLDGRGSQKADNGCGAAFPRADGSSSSLVSRPSRRVWRPGARGRGRASKTVGERERALLEPVSLIRQFASAAEAIGWQSGFRRATPKTWASGEVSSRARLPRASSFYRGGSMLSVEHGRTTMPRPVQGAKARLRGFRGSPLHRSGRKR